MPHLSWDQYFMSLAILVSLRSKDPSTKVGCVLVKNHKVVGTGYNGFPTGCDESQFTWERDIDTCGLLDTKYPYVIHAEANALLNTTSSTQGASAYVTLFPCHECAKLLTQAGVSHVYYLSDKYHEEDTCVASRKILAAGGITYTHLPAEDLNLPLTLDAYQLHFDS